MEWVGKTDNLSFLLFYLGKVVKNHSKMEIYERQKELYDETMCEDQGLPRCYYDERKGNPILKYGGRDEESCFELEHE